MERNEKDQRKSLQTINYKMNLPDLYKELRNVYIFNEFQKIATGISKGISKQR